MENDVPAIRMRSSGRRRLLGRLLMGAVATSAAVLTATRAVAAKPAAPADAARCADDMQIRRLAVSYAFATDAYGRNDPAAGLELYNRTFTSEAQIMVAGTPESARVGPAAWGEYVASVFRGSAYDRTQHLIGSIDVQFPSDLHDLSSAHMASYLHATHHKQDGTLNWVVLGSYADYVLRKDGQWRIAKRTLTVMTSWNEKLP